MRILIADDTKSIQILLGHLLNKWGHEVLVAEDGQKAWEIIQQTPIQFLISDWMMPGMDGPTLCRKIREAHFPNYLYIILLTAIGDKDSIVEGIEAGADDYLAKPFNAEELRVRIQSGVRLLQLESELKERNELLAAAYASIRADLEAAAVMQRNLLPSPLMSFGNVHFDWLFLPAAIVAGDILNYFRIVDDHHVAFYQLDVSGHGIPSAMLSVTLSKLITPETRADNLVKTFDAMSPGGVCFFPPDVMVAGLNKIFQRGNESGLYFTIVYGILDTSTGELQFCQAGHPTPIILPAEEPARLIGDGGFPVGMFPDLPYESVKVTLKRKDRFFLYSDGITECANAGDGSLFGEERLMKFIEDTRKLPVSEISTALRNVLTKWGGSEVFEDDVSFLALEMN